MKEWKCFKHETRFFENPVFYLNVLPITKDWDLSPSGNFISSVFCWDWGIYLVCFNFRYRLTAYDGYWNKFFPCRFPLLRDFLSLDLCHVDQSTSWSQKLIWPTFQIHLCHQKFEKKVHDVLERKRSKQKRTPNKKSNLNRSCHIRTGSKYNQKLMFRSSLKIIWHNFHIWISRWCGTFVK
jgi:hypothetical protein